MAGQGHATHVILCIMVLTCFMIHWKLGRRSASDATLCCQCCLHFGCMKTGEQSSCKQWVHSGAHSRTTLLGYQPHIQTTILLAWLFWHGSVMVWNSVYINCMVLYQPSADVQIQGQIGIVQSSRIHTVWSQIDRVRIVQAIHNKKDIQPLDMQKAYENESSREFLFPKAKFHLLESQALQLVDPHCPS